MSMNPQQLKNIVEAALLAAGEPLTLDRLQTLFLEHEMPAKDELRATLEDLAAECAQRGLEIKEVGSGYRMHVKADMAQWVSRLWEEKPQKYSRATLETLALIAYRQPISRAEIETVRGVSVSTNIIKSLTDRDWVRVVGHREVPGRPALYGTTRGFLDYFNLHSLEELPTLAALRNLDEVARSLDATLTQSDVPPVDDEEEQIDVQATAEGVPPELASVTTVTAENIDAEIAASADSSGSAVESAALETVALPLADDERAAIDAASTEPPARPPRRPVRDHANENGTEHVAPNDATDTEDDTASPQVANG